MALRAPEEKCVRSKLHGFTLIELMITVAVVAILSAIAYPSYQEYVLRSRRVEAQSLLGEAAARQERWRAQNGGYKLRRQPQTALGTSPRTATTP